MILGIGHYNDRKQAQFVSLFKARMEGDYRVRVEQVSIDHLPSTPKGIFVVTGIQTEAAAALVKERRGLLVKIIHPGVVPTTDAERALLAFDWDYILGISGEDQDLAADARELADWLGGHSLRPDQPLVARQHALQIESEAINGNNTQWNGPPERAPARSGGRRDDRPDAGLA